MRVGERAVDELASVKGEKGIRNEQREGEEEQEDRPQEGNMG